MSAEIYEWKPPKRKLGFQHEEGYHEATVFLLWHFPL
jgi:hypothetical protein